MCRIFDNETIQWIIIPPFYNNNNTKPQLLWNNKQSSRIIILLQIRKREKLFLNVDNMQTFKLKRNIYIDCIKNNNYLRSINNIEKSDLHLKKIHMFNIMSNLTLFREF